MTIVFLFRPNSKVFGILDYSQPKPRRNWVVYRNLFPPTLQAFGPVGSGQNVNFNDPRFRLSGGSGGTRGPAGSAALEHKEQLPTGAFPPGVTSTYLAGRYCVAKFDFSAEFEGEMSFKRGDRIRVLGEEDDNWWYAELVPPILDGSPAIRGLIPANYVELLPQVSTGGAHSSASRLTPSFHPARTS
ncbi:unnamed protein product [Dicrocoelium dendriticum]|nr:unnamed protein product [Dicrocoelium dendriticum]